MMTRALSLLGTSLLVVLAAACGDDGGNNSGTCGDGSVTGSEACDDGNTTSLDGCSATCRVESLCGNGTFDVSSEQCDDGNMMSGDGCSSACQKEGTCGNSVIEPGETCDDGNMASSDGCNAACTTEVGWTCNGEPSTCTEDGGGGGAGTCASPSTITLTAMGTDLVGTANGDTTGGTSSLPEAACDGDVAGGGTDNIWRFTTTDVRDVLITLTPSVDFDGGIRLMTACDVTTELTDQVGDDGCSDYSGGGGEEYLGYVNLPAGTYYVSVDGYTATDAGAYSLTISASTTSCGDGLLGFIEFCDDGNMVDGDGCSHCTVDADYNCDSSEPSVCQAVGCGDGILQDPEECDDDNTDATDGCSATCEIESGYLCTGEPSVCVEAGCGNGIIEDATEECDDGNEVSGDRCSSACVLEQNLTEAAEPNNTTALALGSANVIVRGELGDDDVDLYTFTLTGTSKVEIETYSTINGTSTDYGGAGTNGLFDCLTEEDDSELAVFEMGDDTTMDALALAVDDDDGDAYCSYLGTGDTDGPDPTELAALPAGTYTIRVRPSPIAVTIPAGTRYMLDLKITPMGTGAEPPAAGDLKINEFLAADGGSTNGGVDSNCDGSLTDSNDEFIELVNVSTTKTLDLTGVTYADALGVKFTFAAQSTGSLTLAPGKAVVIWGGGTPMCPGVTNFFINGTFKSLSLNDAGDTITIASGGATPVTLATATYASGTIGKSLNLSPDVTGTVYALHALVTGAVGDFSPGKKANGTAF